MQIKTGLITAAGDRQRRIPLQTLVDRDGATRTVLAMLVNEAVRAGAEEVYVIIPAGEQEEYTAAVPEHRARLRFLPQAQPEGYAQALFLARDVLRDQAFLHLVGDHVYINRKSEGWAASLVELAKAEECSVSALQPTHESLICRFGVTGGQPLGDHRSLYQIETVLEKPTPTEAEQRLVVSGLRAGYYLAFFGMHVFTPGFWTVLEETLASDGPRASVSSALNTLASRERYLGWSVTAHRYDLGPRYGLLNAQLALALSGQHREEVLSNLLGLVATHVAGDLEPVDRE